MKKILFIVLLFTSIGFSQSIPVVKKEISFLADSVAYVELSRNLFVAGIYMPRGKTITLKVDVYNDSTDTYYRMSDNGTDYTITIDSTKATYNLLPPVKFYGLKSFKFLIGKDVADTLKTLIDLRPY